jgi:enoyl-CoA hydratase/carnithine racemase
MDSALIAEQKGPVGWITISRPEKRNAITLEMWYELQRSIAELTRLDIRALVITGAGDKAFASGADIAEFGTTKSNPAAARESFLAVDDTCRQLTELSIPVIAAIDGYAIGGGLMLAIACDYRIATQRAQLGITAAKIGITVGQGHIRRLVAATGPSSALDLLLSGRLVEADEALRIGLLHRIVSDKASLLREAQALGELFVERAPTSLAWAKRQVYEIIAGTPALSPEVDAERSIQCFESKDFLEGVRAFQDKRRPRFTIQ